MMGRVEKLDSILMKEISSIIQFDLNNPEIGFCTVSEVRLTNDLSKAKVYVSFFGNNYGVAALKKSKGFIKSELAKRLKMKKIPDLEFVVDDTLDKVSRIEEIVSKDRKDQ
ncbi:MAG: 30S ribosome-binding factor RbfA [Erysipelotrichaceae bacterium]|nr:30S ribosome-binding factor RbfA [Erysipelotrichaceae bacterium]